MLAHLKRKTGRCKTVIECKLFFSAIEFLHKKFGKYLQPGGDEGDLTGVVTGITQKMYL